MILGITLFAAITGTITSYIVTRRAGESTSGGDVATLIRSLGALHTEGLITADELQAKKEELLARM